MSEALTQAGATDKPVAVSTTSPKSNTQGKAVQVAPLNLNDIPTAMDKMGWKVSAQMMRHWFSIKPAWEMTKEIKEDSSYAMRLKPSQYNDQIIKMEWVRKFDRANQVINDLYNHWASEAGLDLLRSRLKKVGWTSNSAHPIHLGGGLNTARELNVTCQINFKPVGSMSDTIDDFYGAIGRAVFHIAVVGSAIGNTFTVERLGIYLRDTYDFEGGSQPLGVWNRDRCLSKSEVVDYLANPIFFIKYPDFVPIFNRDFRRWQEKHNEGGDFVVYSDVFWVKPNITTLNLEIPTKSESDGDSWGW